MRSRIQQWGNSLALRIPRPFAKDAGLRRHTEVEVSLVDGNVVISAIEDPEPTLEMLLAQVTEDNLHSEVDTGPPLGKEVW